ncbi:MAG: tRNA (pseudouridine(54)-N(1))-methyltransferase TrmY [Candidatus Bipolaricaulia bacterium]
MRTFIVIGHKVPLDPNFSLNDLPGSAGRLDVLCRCVNSVFTLSHDIRRDVQLYLVLQDRVALRFSGARLRHLNPDERSTAALIRRALSLRTRGGATGEERESTPGVFVSERGLEAVLDKVRDGGTQVIVLHEAGTPLRETELFEPVAFVLSDHLNYTEPEERLLSRFEQVSVGPRVLHADHCITIVHNELDLRKGEQ